MRGPAATVRVHVKRSSSTIPDSCGAAAMGTAGPSETTNIMELRRFPTDLLIQITFYRHHFRQCHAFHQFVHCN
jgi:hypothetical protein